MEDIVANDTDNMKVGLVVDTQHVIDLEVAVDIVRDLGVAVNIVIDLDVAVKNGFDDPYRYFKL